ncbi:SDR family NAD(P)-dependent oxidoreductase [Rhizohabitans arisaemae]|uniref:SDR family NAD(P)-dependent oxidoreductase n=1 Tax=Rhizohabitans arisaemae TaxID=2720610 RepID=UPI0024B20EA3|nr:SDR family NAD(P)-dependent oxidoreductase [Rhizohabitans arisaemae]
MDLTNTTAFITGAAQGIGLGIARALARQGSRLALTDIDDTALGEAAAELTELTEVAAFHLDVRDREAYAHVADEAEERLGPVTVLCNNAGLAFPERPADMTYELWDLALDVNLGGVVNGIQTFLPRMIRRGAPAHLLNTASAAGLIGAGVGPMYTSSKFAVVGLSESLRHQLQTAGHPVGVTVLCPGGVATNIAKTSRTLIAAQDGGPDLRRAQDNIDQLMPKVDAAVASFGVPADTVGDLVVEAIGANRLYVLTDRAGIDLITARTQDILSAMPETDPVEGDLDNFRSAVYEQ